MHGCEDGAPTRLRSALYEGTVTHRRAEPAHRFTSRVALPLLFLDELPGLRTAHPLVDLDPSAHRRRWPAAIRFHRDDYLPSGAPTVQGAVAEAVAGAGGSVRGPVAMLGHVRTWGWLFNPLTLFYCFDPSGRDVEWTVLEVSNTPWHERHHYVVGPPGEHTLREGHARLALLAGAGHLHACAIPHPGEGIRVSLDVAAPARLRRMVEGTNRTPTRWRPGCPPPWSCGGQPLDRAGLARLLWAYPLMTTRVSGGIYAQAVRLAARGAPFHPHPARGDVAAAPMGDAMAHSGGRKRQMSRTSARCSSTWPGAPAGERPGTLRFEGSGVPGRDPS